MKRAETFWQFAVLFLILLMTIGIYTTLGFMLKRLREGRQAAALVSSLSSATVQIVEPLDGTVLQNSGPYVVRVALVESGYVRAELLVDGETVAAQANPNPRARAWMIDWGWMPPGEGAHVLTVQAEGPSAELETSAPVTVTVVPEGQLVFASNRDGAYAIYSMGTDGQEQARLTTGPGDARQPALRQDGVLAFVVKTGTSPSMIRQMGGGSEGSEDLIAGREPAWFLDGEGLAFSSSPKGVSQVFVAATAGVALSQVTDEEVYAGQPTWSPDGERLAYVARREGNWDIWTSAADGSVLQRLTDDPGQDLSPAWSPDGSQIAFASDRGGSFQIYVIDVPTGADGDSPVARPLTDLARGAESPAWSLDGFWLAFVAYTGDGAGVDAREIYLMRADGRQQVRLTRNAFDDTEPDWSR